MKRVVVGVGGASGAIYAQRTLAALARRRDEVEVALVLTKTARIVWADELGTDPADLGFAMWSPMDMTAPFASGSARYDAMVVVPCSGGGLARIAHGLSADLVGRAADVMLKERRPLILVLRESPYSLVHARNLVSVTEAGAVVLPASPSFYSRPATLEAAVDTVVARILDHLGVVDHDLMPRWEGLRPREDG
jgi:4-hydroxy-3-polyprenylbenzoate decarboxylase